MMRSTRCGLFLLPALLLALCGCGGSGSSGFDVRPLNENAVIAEVLDSGECQSGDGLTICRAAASVEAVPGQPSPTPSSERDVALVLPAGDGLACAPAGDGSGCALVVTFRPGNFPGARFRLAVRSAAPPGPWRVSGEVSAEGTSFAVAVDVPLDATSVQVAVLVFDGGFEPQAGPVETLADTGASSAFVSQGLPLALRP